MKKSCFLLAVFALLSWSVKTQTLFYDAVPEGIFPDAYSWDAKKVSHVSAARVKDYKGYSWCSDDPSRPGGIVLFGPSTNSQFFPILGVQDLEVVFCDNIAIASYYIPGEGIFVNTYRYSSLTSTFSVLDEKKLISATGKKPRISATGQDTYLNLTESAAITWEEPEGIIVKIMKKISLLGLGNLSYGNNLRISGTEGGKIPDVSIGFGGGLIPPTLVHVSFFDPSSSNIKVLKQDLNILSLLTGLVANFNIADAYAVSAPISYIDICQPYNSEGWAYAFVMNNAISVRGYSSAYSSIISTFSITDYPYLNTIEQRKPSISFSYVQDGFSLLCDRVMVAWSMKGRLQAEGLFYVNRKIDGSYITPNGTFHVVPSNRDHNELYGQVAVSKNIDRSSSTKMLAYSVDDMTAGLEMRYKNLPGSYSHSRGAGETAAVEQLAASSLTVYPNPFSDYFQLEAEDYKQGQQLDLQLIDFTGRIVFSTKGDVGAVNTQLKTACPELNAGVYVVKVDGNEQQTIKIVKQ